MYGIWIRSGLTSLRYLVERLLAEIIKTVISMAVNPIKYCAFLSISELADMISCSLGSENARRLIAPKETTVANIVGEVITSEKSKYAPTALIRGSRHSITITIVKGMY